MERKLASIQRIEQLDKIYDINGKEADNIILAHVMGWRLVVKKDEFIEGDLCVFFECDSILPEKDWSWFLISKKFRIKIMKLNNWFSNGLPVVSQGLALPVSILKDSGLDWNYDDTLIGVDVTEVLGIKKYEIPEMWTKAGIKGVFHPLVPKTDEIRVQSAPAVIETLKGLPYYITQKLDGTSCTVVNDGEIKVYSRNLQVDEQSNYYSVVERDGVIAALLLNPNIAIQGEIVGENIQGNKLNLVGNEFYAFNVYDITRSRYLDFKAFIKFCKDNDIRTVPILEKKNVFEYNLDELEMKAKGHYLSGYPQEGIVVRPQKEMYYSFLEGRLSFKVINIDFLLKEK